MPNRLFKHQLASLASKEGANTKNKQHVQFLGINIAITISHKLRKIIAHYDKNLSESHSIV